MSRAAGPRGWLWSALLLGAAALALLGDKSPVDAVVSATAGAQPPAAANAALSSPAERSAFKLRSAPQALALDLPLDRAGLYPPAQPSSRPRRDLFAVVSWLPAPAAAAAAPPRPAETGPAWPTLTVVGKKHEAQQWEVYLAQGDRTQIAREGATIDDGLRVERIAPPTMTLTVVATGQTMTVDVGEAR